MGAQYTQKLISLPIPFMIRSLTGPSLFAGKLHAIIARSYLNRVKGRDYYDLLFYAARKTKVNLMYLEAKLKNSDHYNDKDTLTVEKAIVILKNKIKEVDFEKAKKDVIPFIKPMQRKAVEHWNRDLSSALCDQLEAE